MDLFDLASVVVNTLLCVVAVAVLNNTGALAYLARRASSVFGRRHDDETITEPWEEEKKSSLFEPLSPREMRHGGYETDETVSSTDGSSCTEAVELDDDNRNKGPSRSVRFSNISIRSYDIAPLPEADQLSLDWSYSKEKEVPVEVFEKTKSPRLIRKSHTRRKIVGTPLSGPKKLRKLNNRKRVVAKTESSSFPSILQFSALMSSRAK